MPENISELSADQINARIREIVGEFSSLSLSVDSVDDDITKGEALAAEVTALRAELGARETAAVERTNRLSVLGDTFAQDDEPEAAPADEPVPAVEDADEPVEEAVADETPAVEVEEALPVAASASKPSPAKRAAAHAPEVKMPKSSSAAVITAAADVPNYAAGQEFDSLTAAGEAIINRARSLPTHGIPGTRLRYGALKIRKTGFGEFVQDTMDDYSLVQKVGDERRLKGGSLALTADAWCAPSETMYDMCQYETAAGLLSLPEFQVTRGGIRYTSGPDFSAIYSDPDFYFHVTAAGVITDGAGVVKTAKPCGTIDCPTFDDVRLEVDGVCISVDILANVGYPELTRRVTEGVLVAHARKMNSRHINAISTAAGAAILVPDNTTLLFNLDYLEWYAESTRTGYSLADNAGVEVVLPTWIKPLIRAEIGRRNGVESWNTPDSAITQFFSVRNLTVQFVRDWQPLAGPVGAVPIPSVVLALMYPAGSWAKGTQGVISLDTIYDSALLAQNKYMGLFTEEATLMVQKCLGTVALQIPVTVSGLSGAQITEILGT